MEQSVLNTPWWGYYTDWQENNRTLYPVSLEALLYFDTYHKDINLQWIIFVIASTYQASSQLLFWGAKEGIAGDAALHKNIVVKVPCTQDGIKTICQLTKEGIRTNCTLIFNLGQAVLAAKAGATYVSPFVGRLDDISSDGVSLIADIVETFETYGFNTQVLAASIRHTQHIIDCMRVGADVATCPLKAILGLLKHPLTDSGLAAFIADQERVAKQGK